MIRRKTKAAKPFETDDEAASALIKRGKILSQFCNPYLDVKTMFNHGMVEAGIWVIDLGSDGSDEDEQYVPRQGWSNPH